eukprot:jgi/Chrpa1/9968/Chrysochromulina_OHIO_Genome00017293-RA
MSADVRDVEAPASAVAGPSEVFFRELEERDVTGLMELQRGLFPVQYTESFYTKLFTPGYYCIVGVAPDGEIVAVVSARAIAFATAHEQQSSREAYIMTLGVKDSYRRQRIGMKLMDIIFCELRAKTDCEYATLHVKTINRAAVSYYEKLGFTCDPQSGFLPSHYYIDGQHWDAYRYTRPLRGPLLAFVHEYCTLL